MSSAVPRTSSNNIVARSGKVFRSCKIHPWLCVCVSVRECLLFCLCVLSGAAINLNTTGSAGCLHHLVTDDMKIYSHDIYPFLNLNSHRPPHKLTCNSELLNNYSLGPAAGFASELHTHALSLIIIKSQSKTNRPSALRGFPPARSCCTTACTYVLFFFSVPYSGCSALVWCFFHSET